MHAIARAAAGAVGLILMPTIGLVGSPAAAAVTPSVGTPLMAVHSGKCLDVFRAQLGDGPPLEQHRCHGNANQRFTFEPKGDGTFQIVAEHSGKCLDVYMARPDNSTVVNQITCHGGDNQRWTVRPVPGATSFEIVAKHSGKCLDVAGLSTNDSVPIHQYTCHGGANQRWYAAPATATTSPALPVDRSTPVTSLQVTAPTEGQLGGVQYAYVDNIGRLLIAHQPNPDIYQNVQYTVVSGNEAFSGRPALAERPDARLQLVAHNTETDVWTRVQTVRGSAAWGTWGDTGGSTRRHPVLGKLPNGSLVAFAVGDGGQLWHLPLGGADIPAMGWRAIGGNDLTGQPTLAVGRDGLHVFARTTTGTAVTATYRAGALGEFSPVGATLTDPPTAMVYPGYRLRLVGRTPAGTVVTATQDAAGAWPTTWDTVGADLVAAGAPAVILDPITGKAVIVARDTQNRIRFATETAQGSGTFGPWQGLGGDDTDVFGVSDPMVAEVTNSGGPAWHIVFRDLNDQVRVHTRRPDASLTARIAGPRLRFDGHVLPPAPRP